MTDRLTYPPRPIGVLTHPTREERNREGDRWVSLRTIAHAPAAPLPDRASEAPTASPTRELFRSVDRRHAEARRKLGL